MATKKYKLTDAAIPFFENEADSKFKFRVAWCVPGPEGGTIIRSRKSCPILSLSSDGVVETSCIITQNILERFRPRGGVVRDGVQHEGLLFDDVTSEDPQTDLNLDLILT